MSAEHTDKLFAGAVAGIVSRTAIAPIERVKILSQLRVGGGAVAADASLPDLVRHVARSEGVSAFWKGNTAAVTRVVPYMSITFLSYEEFKERLLPTMPKQPATLVAGSLAGLTAVAATYPLDLIRATMAVPGHPYKSMLDALTTIARERGVGALYAGIGATSLGVAPYAGLKFATYEALKVALGDFLGIRESALRPWQRVSAGALAGVVAQTFVYPFDVIRRRMQTGKLSLAGRPYAGVFDALQTISKEEGVRGLYRGLSLNYIKTMPNVAIYMSLYDVMRIKLRDLRA